MPEYPCAEPNVSMPNFIVFIVSIFLLMRYSIDMNGYGYFDSADKQNESDGLGWCAARCRVPKKLLTFIAEVSSIVCVKYTYRGRKG